MVQKGRGGSGGGRTDGRDAFGVSDPNPRLRSPEFQHWEDRSSLLLVVKTSGDWGSERNCWIFAANRASMVLECTQTYPLGDSLPEQQMEGHQVHMGRG